jgi:hypothetical protein
LLQARIDASCDANDTFCDRGFSTQVHLTYLNRYPTQAATFVLARSAAEPASASHRDRSWITPVVLLVGNPPPT